VFRHPDGSYPQTNPQRSAHDAGDFKVAPEFVFIDLQRIDTRRERRQLRQQRIRILRRKSVTFEKSRFIATALPDQQIAGYFLPTICVSTGSFIRASKSRDRRSGAQARECHALPPGNICHACLPFAALQTAKPVPNFISEDQIEQTLLQKLQHVHGYDVLDCNTEEREDLADRSCRASKREVILLDRLREAAVALNPGIPAAVIDSALEKLTDRRLAMLPVPANRDVYELIRDGIPMEFEDAKGQRQEERVRVIDFEKPERKENQFLAVSQLWVKGEKGFWRPDVLLYVNGLPLVFIELKNSNVKLKAAFDDNLTTYQSESCSYCSPTRAAMLTGRYQQRFGHEFNPGAVLVPGRNDIGLPWNETLLPQRLKPLGSRACEPTRVAGQADRVESSV
jgi:hypothetical protein